MARHSRIKSETGIYHIMLRGNNKQQIFYDLEDYSKFLSVLGICKDLSDFKLYAYCLMNNHIHLLIQEGDEPLDILFKRIGARFVYWYNAKYDRVGNLFQSRFKSIPVNDDEYFISVLRYIHQNPVKAKIVKSCDEYDFSSYNAYFNYAPLVDTEFAMELIGSEEFIRIHNEPIQEKHLELSDKDTVRLTEEKAKSVFESNTHCKSPEEFQRYPKDMQFAYITLLRGLHLSVRQICKLTGVAKYIVQEH